MIFGVVILFQQLFPKPFHLTLHVFVASVAFFIYVECLGEQNTLKWCTWFFQNRLMPCSLLWNVYLLSSFSTMYYILNYIMNCYMAVSEITCTTFVRNSILSQQIFFFLLVVLYSSPFALIINVSLAFSHFTDEIYDDYFYYVISALVFQPVRELRTVRQLIHLNIMY